MKQLEYSANLILKDFDNYGALNFFVLASMKTAVYMHLFTYFFSERLESAEQVRVFHQSPLYERLLTILIQVPALEV